MSPIEKDPSRGMNAAVAAELRAERAARQLTVEQLAERSLIPKRTLLRLLNAERSINIEHLAAMAEALDTDPIRIMNRAEQRYEDMLRSPDFYTLAADEERMSPEEEAHAFEDLP
jgi:transcriptional regulator with XRE-family HTH domain